MNLWPTQCSFFHLKGAISRNKEILHSVLNYNSLSDLDIHKVYKDLLTDITALPKTFKTVSRIYVKNSKKLLRCNS
ncbi:hypothetical protein chiPu_0027083 [Chiloscyllium punctatum]|uniref:Uncharacterized protein n=1 Tax=Chiloscyllium punctatum TaxID=137246 RepID=A0A401TKE3_CHIPU|nr:hypothetical protein [Chiloscyllium punctatum]